VSVRRSGAVSFSGTRACLSGTLLNRAAPCQIGRCPGPACTEDHMGDGVPRRFTSCPAPSFGPPGLAVLPFPVGLLGGGGPAAGATKYTPEVRHNAPTPKKKHSYKPVTGRASLTWTQQAEQPNEISFYNAIGPHPRPRDAQAPNPSMRVRERQADERHHPPSG
jgi:hypothetical protein